MPRASARFASTRWPLPSYPSPGNFQNLQAVSEGGKNSWKFPWRVGWKRTLPRTQRRCTKKKNRASSGLLYCLQRNGVCALPAPRHLRSVGPHPTAPLRPQRPQVLRRAQRRPCAPVGVRSPICIADLHIVMRLGTICLHGVPRRTLAGLCALLAADAFAPTALPMQSRARFATSSTRPAAAVGLRMSAAPSQVRARGPCAARRACRQGRTARALAFASAALHRPAGRVFRPVQCDDEAIGGDARSGIPGRRTHITGGGGAFSSSPRPPSSSRRMPPLLPLMTRPSSSGAAARLSSSPSSWWSSSCLRRASSRRSERGALAGVVCTVVSKLNTDPQHIVGVRKEGRRTSPHKTYLQILSNKLQKERQGRAPRLPKRNFSSRCCNDSSLCLLLNIGGPPHHAVPKVAFVHKGLGRGTAIW